MNNAGKLQRPEDVIINEGKIIFPNFSGMVSQYNRNGDKSFCVLLPSEVAQIMAEDGWNVKILRPNPNIPLEDQETIYYLPVAVRFDRFPPRIIMVTKRSQTQLTNETVGVLDSSDIQYADLVITGSPWAEKGDTGIKAYVKTMYVVVQEDVFADKYRTDAQTP